METIRTPVIVELGECPPSAGLLALVTVHERGITSNSDVKHSADTNTKITNVAAYCTTKPSRNRRGDILGWEAAEKLISHIVNANVYVCAHVYVCRSRTEMEAMGDLIRRMAYACACMYVCMYVYMYVCV
jgi:hypothetical protein